MSPCEVLPAQQPVASFSCGLQQLLHEFSVTPNGFLPDNLPLQRLPNSYYGPWETLIQDLPALIENGTLREKVDQLPVLSTSFLHTEPEQRRAYVVLCFLANGYIWGGKTAAQILPPPLTLPLLTISSLLGLPPIATYASFNLWNFSVAHPSSASSSSSFRNLDAVFSQHTFTGTVDESWFYSVSIAIEASGATIIPAMLVALDAASHNDFPRATAALEGFVSSVKHLETFLDRMDEKCDPEVFYHKIRPFLAGSKNMENAGLPKGVFYDEGEGKGEWRQLRGGSNGQSSLIQFFDVVLGVEHASNGGDGKGGVSFHEEIRGYMPRAHREFLEHVAGVFPGGMKGVLEGAAKARGEFKLAVGKEEAECVAAFQRATEQLAAFRGRHLRMVTRYIIIPARQAASRAQMEESGVVNLATAPSAMRVTGEGEVAKVELTGTGGTALLPFLKESRDETIRAGEITCK
ncbi:Indoleamine 2,3-dioxygenase [Podospora aff. communis PSN243]|uniref:Indoleamine 2,3-dioxygenase n=1 Tax=Podospora aff. communis PSN243 TaxID=3040156 RepID=A0AAV9G8R4_9PEZI|nr:Indoleamine 2,3-dioxygenase [Podospora aff. communis PSN243]